jgi:D-amino-acid dehydrogenase
MSQPSPNPHHVTVVGAGVVGVASALNLLRDGHRVTVVDRLPPGEACSKGNAGVLAVHSYVPLATPANLRRVPKWLLDPLGPLSIRIAHAPRLIPWFLRFARACTAERVKGATDALWSLVTGAVEHHRDLAAGTGAAGLIRADPYLYVYEDAGALRADGAAWRIRREKGLAFRDLKDGEARELEPALAPIFRLGVLVADGGYTVDPHGFVTALAEAFVRAGGVLVRRNVTGVETGLGGVRRLIAGGESLDVDVLVVAAGAWSGELAARLGDPVPLIQERGYHATLVESGVSLGRPVFWSRRHVVATPMAAGLRIAGTDEFARADAPPDPARARVLLRYARDLFPAVRTERFSDWMGPRPLLPDCLPVIGRSPRHANVLYAFGHHHVGLTAAPRTGRLIADLVAGRTPNVDLRPFRVDRF